SVSVRRSLSNRVDKEVRECIGERACKTIMQRKVGLSEAQSFGKPVLLYDATCVGARNYIAPAGEIIRHANRRGDAGEEAPAGAAVGRSERRQRGSSFTHPPAATHGFAT